jgi:hypothetical protein
MRAENWLQPVPALLMLALSVAGCASPAPTPQGIAEGGDGALTLSTRGPTAAGAVERGLNQASRHCADQNRMIAIQSTRIERDGYNLAFRCLSVPGAPGGMRTASAAPLAASPTGRAEPVSAPLAAVPAVTAEPLTAPPALSVSRGLPPAASPVSQPISPSGTPLPTAAAPLQPIAGSSGAFARPSSALAPSSFWQSGR